MNTHKLNIKIDGHKVKIRASQDEWFEPTAPGMGRLGTFYGRSNRYFNVDETGDINPNDKGYVTIPIYAYVHGSVHFSNAPINAGSHTGWDTGLAGFLRASRADVREFFQVSRITPKVLARAIEALQGDIKTLDMEANGNVYYVRVRDTHTGSEQECSGIYGNAGILAFVNESLQDLFGTDAVTLTDIPTTY